MIKSSKNKLFRFYFPAALIKPIGANQTGWNGLGKTSPVRSLNKIEQDRLQGVFCLTNQFGISHQLRFVICCRFFAYFLVDTRKYVAARLISRAKWLQFFIKNQPKVYNILDMGQTITKDEFTIAEHHFKTVDGLHKLYVQEWGNAKGVPFLYVHGGPGYFCTDRNKSVFDPKKHRVIFVDQRASGQSEPYGSLKENNTQKLVDDFEMIRKKLKIDKWHLLGTSWGSTLSLVYAIRHPDFIGSIITGGIFLGSVDETEWLNNGHFRRFYPEIDEKFVRKTYTPFEMTRLHTATIKLDDRYNLPDKADFDEVPAKIELYYTDNKFFIEPDFILKNANKINVPVEIVQGRYDMMTPPKAAYELHEKLPNSSLHWTIAGHSSSDRANYDITKALLSQII